MPSPRALVRLRVNAEQRLSADIQALSGVLDMPPEEVPQLLVPRVPNNDPGLKHVRFLEGVASIIERFLEHSGVDVDALHAQPEDEDMADHQRPEVNMSGGPNFSPAVGDPRMVNNVGQGLAEPTQPTGVHPGMLEGDTYDVREAVDNVDALHLEILRDMETRRVGGPRPAVMDIINERDRVLKEEAAAAAEPSGADVQTQEERQAEAEAAAEAERLAAEATQPGPQDPSIVGMSPNRQLAPERPAAATKARKSKGGRGSRR